MEYRDIDFRTFAYLRGKEEKSHFLWGLLVSGILFLVGLLLLLSHLGWDAFRF